MPLQGPMGMVIPSAVLPHHRLLWLSLARPRQALRRWGRGRHGLAKGLFSFLGPVHRRQTALPEAVLARVPNPALQGSQVSGRGNRVAKLLFPSRGSPILLPPPPSARRHFVRSRCDTDTISRPRSQGKGSGPHAIGLLPSTHLLPTGQQSYLCLPD